MIHKFVRTKYILWKPIVEFNFNLENAEAYTGILKRSARIKWNDDVLSTSKKDKDKHGYGLKNIKELCEKYQGSMEINIENAIFQLILSFLKI